MRRFVIAALACWACLCANAAARPFTVDDLLHQESFGSVSIDPTGHWLAFEQRDPYDSAARYDLFLGMDTALSRLRVVDLHGGGPSRPLLAHDPGPGIVLGDFSPAGSHVAIYRFQHRRWSLGVATLATGAVRWFPITPRYPDRGRTLAWLTEDTLVVLDRPDGAMAPTLRTGWLIADRLPKAWARQARGEASVSVFGSGRYLPVRARGGPTRLLRLDTRTGAARRLAQGQYFDLELSPDRGRLALFASGADIQTRDGGPARGPAGYETEATRLTVLDLTTGVERAPCPDCDLLPNLLSWAPSGRALLVFDRAPDGLWTHGRLLRIDALSRGVSVVGRDVQPHFDFNGVAVWTGWMGDDPLLFGRRSEASSDRDDWFRLSSSGAVNLTARLPAPEKLVRSPGAGGLTVLAGGDLWRVDGAGRISVSLARSAKPVVFGDLRPAQGARLVRAPPTTAWITTGATGALSLLKLSGGTLQSASGAPEAGDAIVAASPSGADIILHETDPRGPEGLIRLRPGGQRIVVAKVNERLADTDPPNVIPISHSGPEGQSLLSWLYLPTATPRGGAPLLVRPYLGDNYRTPPGDRKVLAGFLENVRVLTGEGYAVLAPSLPNPPGGMTDPASHLAERIEGILQAALVSPAAQGRVDPGRVGLIGWSFGGYTVMETLTQTSRFRAAIEMDGISDFTAYWSALSLGRQIAPELGYTSNLQTGGVETAQPALGAPPWVDPQRYIRNSPLYAADKVQTPLLLIHGALDPVTLSQSEAMYSALFRQGKDALLATYWGEAHSPTSPGDVRDVYSRSFAFLADRLKGPISGDPRSPNPGTASASSAPTLP